MFEKQRKEHAVRDPVPHSHASLWKMSARVGPPQPGTQECGAGTQPGCNVSELWCRRGEGCLALSCNKGQDLAPNLHEFREVRGAAPVPKQTGTCGDTCPAELIMLTCEIYTKKNRFSTDLCSKVALSSAAGIFFCVS